MNQWQGSAGRRFLDVKQKFRLYLRRCGPRCQMSFLSERLFRLRLMSVNIPGQKYLCHRRVTVFRTTRCPAEGRRCILGGPRFFLLMVHRASMGSNPRRRLCCPNFCRVDNFLHRTLVTFRDTYLLRIHLLRFPPLSFAAGPRTAVVIGHLLLI